MSHTIRGEFASAFAYNPFGIVVIGVCILAVASAFLPARWAMRCRHLIGWGSESGERIWWIIGLAFIAFGALRVSLVLLRG